NNISGNIISNNNCGILIWNPYSPVDYNTVSDNIFSDNIVYGMIIDEAKHTLVSNNLFYNDGIWLLDSYYNTFLNNMVNDKPLVYLEDESDKVIEEDAGQVILVNCDNITVQNKDLSNTTVGLLLERTHNCLISGNTLYSDKLVGIFLEYSSNNNISMNMISDTNNGILLSNSYDNIIYFNNITLNEGFGIYLAYSEGNTIATNTILDNYAGLVLTGSSNFNNVTDNVFFNDGAWVYGAWKNNFLNNYVNDKPLIYLEDLSDMTIEDGTAGQVILISCDNIKVRNQ
ncbi:MAG: right-handed parallel beta-helix repeat-containing protein, partial [Thermoplasmatota archaeon]